MLAGILIFAFGGFLIGLAVSIVLWPSIAKRFLLSFAGSARAHYAEQAVRLIVGWALVTRASAMWYPDLFRAFGWLIVLSTIGLLVLPWQRHQKFATLVMPSVISRLRLFALGALTLGVFVLYGLLRGR